MLATEDSERQKGIRLPGDVFRGSFCRSVSIYTVGSWGVLLPPVQFWNKYETRELMRKRPCYEMYTRRMLMDYDSM